MVISANEGRGARKIVFGDIDAPHTSIALSSRDRIESHPIAHLNRLY